MYCTIDDIKEQLPERELIQLTDDAGIGAIDISVVDRAIEDAGAVIDGYVAKKAVVPLDPVPPIIRKHCVDLAICNLYARRVDEIPQAKKERCEQARADLKLFSTGQITLGIQPAPEAPSDAGPDAVVVSSRDKIFGPDTMGKY